MKEVMTTGLFSLLWPDGTGNIGNNRLGAKVNHFVADLSLEELAVALSFDRNHRITVEKLLNKITHHPEIINYRLDIFEDLMANPELPQTFEDILPLLDNLDTPGYVDDSKFLQIVNRLGELEVYVDCIKRLQLGFNGAVIKSRGLSELRQVVNEVFDNADFKALSVQLPKMKAGFSRLASITIGVNLNDKLRPYQATLLSINEREFKGASILSRFSNKLASDSPYQGISPLITIEKIETLKNNQVQRVDNPFHLVFFEEISHIVDSLINPIAAEIRQFTKFNSRLLISLKSELAFLLGAVQLLQKIRATGLPLCRPVVLNKELRTFKCREIYNINLARQQSFTQTDLSQTVVTNDVAFDEEGRIFILTGPNRGGKTTYTQAIGLVQILCQLGIFVPGREAEISPVDAIYSHFPVTEKPDSNMGRLGEESERLNEIFQNATPYSLILLNESLSSTSPGECLYLCRGILTGLKLLGARAVFATHLHELAANLEEFNASIPGPSKLISMVSGVAHDGDSDMEDADFNPRTFKFTPGPPQGLSYARDIAARYGISIEKLVALMQERAIVETDFRMDFRKLGS
ncbi:MAG TPA: hypothetical protein VHY08_29110 [Bacillota bacterium]|nr:hypothetical protein [Bacillota bacterium]